MLLSLLLVDRKTVGYSHKEMIPLILCSNVTHRIVAQYMEQCNTYYFLFHKRVLL